jgi:hypothetical protein
MGKWCFFCSILDLRRNPSFLFVLLSSGCLLLASMIDWCMLHPNSSAHDPNWQIEFISTRCAFALFFVFLLFNSLLM